MSNLTLSVSDQSSLTVIYNDVFNNIKQDHIDIFLCGGVSKNGNTSVRDIVRQALDKKKNIRIIYPEDLFIEIFNRDRNSDLLTLEKFLADNCDCICIICESTGSLVELGVFTSNENTVSKVIAVIEEKEKKRKSFLMRGPLKVIKKINKNNVIFYSKDNIKELNQQLNYIFSINRYNKIFFSKNSIRSINTIIGLYYFIPILFYFYRHIDRNTMLENIKFLFDQNGYKLEDLDWLLNSSIKLLFKHKYIQKHTNGNNIFYALTDKGYESVTETLSKVNMPNRTKLYDNIRLGIIRNKYY